MPIHQVHIIILPAIFPVTKMVRGSLISWAKSNVIRKSINIPVEIWSFSLSFWISWFYFCPLRHRWTLGRHLAVWFPQQFDDAEKSNLHYPRGITPRRGKSSGVYLRSWATKKRRSGGETVSDPWIEPKTSCADSDALTTLPTSCFAQKLNKTKTSNKRSHLLTRKQVDFSVNIFDNNTAACVSLRWLDERFAK